MIRNINVNKKYAICIENDCNKNILKQNISEDVEKTTAGYIDVSLQKILSTDLDVFSDLPKEIYSNVRASYFLYVLKAVILSTDLEGVTLSKLHVSELTEESLVIEWIFNYFRVYFSFEKNEEDTYGMIENNPETQEFSNHFAVLKIEDYEVVARSIVNYIITLGEFK